jgi:hypothetical protein
MVKKETLSRLRWHAGIEDLDIEGLSSVSACTWPGNNAPISALEAAVSDFIRTLSSLNHEMNGEVPSETIGGKDENIPRVLVYAVTEVIRMLREYQETTKDPATVQALGRAAWRAETGWTSVLDGDIDAIEEHLAGEESARFE